MLEFSIYCICSSDGYLLCVCLLCVCNICNDTAREVLKRVLVNVYGNYLESDYARILTPPLLHVPKLHFGTGQTKNVAYIHSNRVIQDFNTTVGGELTSR